MKTEKDLNMRQKMIEHPTIGNLISAYNFSKLEHKKVSDIYESCINFSFRIFTTDGKRCLEFHYFNLEKLERSGVRSGVRSVIK